jgi:hypothetical protein
MEQVMQSLATQLVHNLAPMFISMMVIVAVMLVLLAPVRNRFVRQLGAYAAMLTWVGWLAQYYKVV